eukprot:70244-Chlamydomonas_euryale.AAC.6
MPCPTPDADPHIRCRAPHPMPHTRWATLPTPDGCDWGGVCVPALSETLGYDVGVGSTISKTCERREDATKPGETVGEAGIARGTERCEM